MLASQLDSRRIDPAIAFMLFSDVGRIVATRGSGLVGPTNIGRVLGRIAMGVLGTVLMGIGTGGVRRNVRRIADQR
jgi:hypothetical protein